MLQQSFLQTKEWLELQRSLGRGGVEYEGGGGIRAGVIKHKLPFGKSYLYIPHGPDIDFNSMAGGFKNPVKNFVIWLKRLAREHKAILVKAEPLEDSVAQALVEAGFHKSGKEIQPGKTVVIDLAQSEKELLASMHHKTRYNIKVAEKHDVRVEESNDIETFLKLLKKTAKRDRFSAHEPEYYRQLMMWPARSAGALQTQLFLAYANNHPAAGAIILTYGDTAYYLHGASDYENRTLMAPYALHWHIIQKLKATNCKLYDLWGINARFWPGVTRFKLGWGGKIIEHPGSFDLPISKSWYLIYKIARRVL